MRAAADMRDFGSASGHGGLTGHGAGGAPRARKLPRAWVVAILASPILIVGALFWTMAILLKQPPVMSEPPVGAGAGTTGGVNAIGEMLAGHKANAGIDYRQEENREKRTENSKDASAAGVGADEEQVQPGGRPAGPARGPSQAPVSRAPGQASAPSDQPEMPIVGKTIKVRVKGGAGPGAKLVRDLTVWLPEGYDAPENKDKTYPVLYLMDGQNLFQKHKGIPAEWGVDETATRLIEKGVIEPVIIVGVPHGGPYRIDEYLPDANVRLDKHEAHGQEFVEWMTSVVVPAVEKEVRAKPGAENRAIGGSSLGAMIGLVAGSSHPEVFGNVLAESPSLILGGHEIWKTLFADKKKWAGRVYMGMGGEEYGEERAKDRDNEALVGAATSLRDTIAKVSPGTKIYLFTDLDAVHTEQAWADRLPKALEFLFPAAKVKEQPAGTKSTEKPGLGK